MNSDDFGSVVDHRMNICKDVLLAKAKYYAPGHDRLGQFKLAHELCRTISPTHSALVLMTKHVTKFYDMVLGYTPRTDADVDEVLTDLHNYLYLIEALVWETKNGSDVGSVLPQDMSDSVLEQQVSEQADRSADRKGQINPFVWLQRPSEGSAELSGETKLPPGTVSKKSLGSQER